MSLTMTNERKAFELAPEGTFPAVCDRIVDMGYQETNFGTKRKVWLRWQIDAPMEDGRPFTIGQMYTLSMNEKANLRKAIEAWRGTKFTAEDEKTGFDLQRLLATGCLLQVIHNDRGEKTYANVGAIMALPKGSKAPAVEGEAWAYDADIGTPEQFADLPGWLQEKISNPEAKLAPAFSGQKQAEGDSDVGDFKDEIPFAVGGSALLLSFLMALGFTPPAQACSLTDMSIDCIQERAADNDRDQRIRELERRAEAERQRERYRQAYGECDSGSYRYDCN